MIITKASCPSGWDAFEGKCFMVTSGKFTRSQCETECGPGKLACVTSKAENDFIQTKNSDVGLMIGYTDKEVEGSWVWEGADCSENTFTNWATDEPNQFGEEDCAVLLGPKNPWSLSGGLLGPKWADVGCKKGNDYNKGWHCVCEIDNSPTSAPTVTFSPTVSSAPTTIPTEFPCPDETWTWGGAGGGGSPGKCFKTVASGTHLECERDHCGPLGASLVCLASQEEASFVTENLGFDGTYSSWTGLYNPTCDQELNQQKEAGWLSSNGCASPYYKWQKSPWIEPDNHQDREHCATISNNGIMFGASCDNVWGYPNEMLHGTPLCICEWPAQATDEYYKFAAELQGPADFYTPWALCVSGAVLSGAWLVIWIVVSCLHVFAPVNEGRLNVDSARSACGLDPRLAAVISYTGPGFTLIGLGLFTTQFKQALPCGDYAFAGTIVLALSVPGWVLLIVLVGFFIPNSRRGIRGSVEMSSMGRPLDAESPALGAEILRARPAHQGGVIDAQVVGIGVELCGGGGGGKNLTETLRELENAKKEGLLSEEDFQAARRKAISGV
eukprot:CAMPEP_0172583784 /NCGR_PEP_ID=MMETSP1068-20121228/3330_1 /TAXON_ID=35684 /ORGANISM="Pseudopedinella elastica, Strain CCMP716" /LENGTH=555 /DNA_ID=CAMNT_0013377697 /DNA_START=114 /DNA_END=1781 /DNA_ORIENTATION=+